MQNKQNRNIGCQMHTRKEKVLTEEFKNAKINVLAVTEIKNEIKKRGIGIIGIEKDYYFVWSVVKHRKRGN